MERKFTFTISIKKNSIYYFLMIIPFVPMAYLIHLIPRLDAFYLYARIFVIFLLLLRLIFIRRRFKATLGLAILFFVMCFFSTFINGQAMGNLLSYSTFLFGFTLLVEDGIYFDVDAFVGGCLLFFEILIYANLLFFIWKPNGYQENYYLFGNYNSTIRYVFPGIILGAIHAFKLKNRITLRFCCMFLAFLVFLIALGSMTSIFGMAIFAVAILYYMWRKKSGLFKFEFFILLSVVITIVVAVLGRFNLFENFITVLLGKDMTLSGRTLVWAQSISEISKRPIWGYGQLGNEATRNYLIGFIDPHNIFLGFLFYGGIVGLGALTIILLLVLRQIRNGRKMCPQIAMIFDAGCCAYFLMWNFETVSKINEFSKIFFFFVMAFYCVNFSKGIKKCDDSIVKKT